MKPIATLADMELNIRRMEEAAWNKYTARETTMIIGDDIMEEVRPVLSFREDFVVKGRGAGFIGEGHAL